jgi:formyltetrahydrofolate deformylase
MTTTVEHVGAEHRRTLPGEAAAPSRATARLMLSCADVPGTSALTMAFLARRGADIVEADQHVSDGVFLMRLAFRLDGAGGRLADLRHAFAAEFAGRSDVHVRFHDATKPKRVALFVSRSDHCLLDLLRRCGRGGLPVEIGLVISNHTNLAERVAAFGVPFAHVPVTPGKKAEAEWRQCELLSQGFDLVVLARYMQILSGTMLGRLGMPVINIHHSLLPAFPGGRPYERARQQGVKFIGATAHYVTEELDEGPIIEQDTVRVSHRQSLDDLVRIGADIERLVLARAVRWHCEDRVVVIGNTTVVF